LEQSLFITAFITGLLGSVHCVGMCGGIVGALTIGLDNSIKQSPLKLLPYLLTYNFGRIFSYIVAGIIVGFVGSQLTQQLSHYTQINTIISGIFMILLGLYLGSWWQILVKLEELGKHFWKIISPYGKNFLPIRNVWQALGLGLIWGWLPCGLVYVALGLSFSAKTTVDGGLTMLFFGLGTLPMLLTIGTFSQWLAQFVHNLLVRRIAGLIIIIFGLIILLRIKF
jgi:sulfite exporter TauE/SafE